MESNNQEAVILSQTIGIDLGGSRIKAAIVGRDGNIVSKIIKPIAAVDDYPAIVSQLEDMVKELVSGSVEPSKGIGVGVAGLMDKDRQEILTSPNIVALNSRNLAMDLTELVGLPTVMDNDANLMAVSEGTWGAARGCSHYIAITLGTGVGGAVISDGTLIRGFNGGGGEVGHILVNPDGPRCNCGAHGCLEAFVGQAGIKRYVSEKHPDLDGNGLKELNQLALQGNQEAVDVFRYIGVILGAGLAGLVNVFNPECIVIGGGVATAGDLLFNPFDNELRKRAFKVYLEGLQIRPAMLGNWAGVVGAGIIAQNL